MRKREPDPLPEENLQDPTVPDGVTPDYHEKVTAQGYRFNPQSSAYEKRDRKGKLIDLLEIEPKPFPPEEESLAPMKLEEQPMRRRTTTEQPREERTERQRTTAVTMPKSVSIEEEELEPPDEPTTWKQVPSPVEDTLKGPTGAKQERRGRTKTMGGLDPEDVLREPRSYRELPRTEFVARILGGGFTMIPNGLLEGGISGPMAAAFPLLQNVIRYCYMNKGMCTASLERLTRDTGSSRRTVQRALKYLLTQELLEEVQDDRGRKGLTPGVIGFARLALEVRKNIQEAERLREEIRKGRSKRGRQNVQLRGK